MVEQASLMIPVLPMLAALVVALRMVTGAAQDDAAERSVVRLTLGAAGLVLLLLLLLDMRAVWLGEPPGHIVFGSWLVSGDYHIDVSLMLDTLGLAMGTLVALIAFSVLIALMNRSTQVTLYGGGALIFDEYGRLKFHVSNSIHNRENQTRRLCYLWQYGFFDKGSAGMQRFSRLHRLRAMNLPMTKVEV